MPPWIIPFSECFLFLVYIILFSDPSFTNSDKQFQDEDSGIHLWKVEEQQSVSFAVPGIYSSERQTSLSPLETLTCSRLGREAVDFMLVSEIRVLFTVDTVLLLSCLVWIVFSNFKAIRNRILSSFKTDWK